MLEHNKNQRFSTSTFYKKTYTGLLTNPIINMASLKLLKIGHIKSIVLGLDYIKILMLFAKIYKEIVFQSISLRTVLTNTLTKRLILRKMTPNLEPRYFKLPFIGQFSSLTKNRLNKIVIKFCKDNIYIKVIFTPFKIGSMFSSKDPIQKQ